MLAERGCRVTVVPAQTPAADVLELKPDGVFLSNGPGDPEPCDYAIAAIQRIRRDASIPTFGICLGHQLHGRWPPAPRPCKMKFGHHGANHPVQDLDDGRVMITSQNHGFAVDETTLPANAARHALSLFDGTLQGIALDRQAGVLLPGPPGSRRRARTTSACRCSISFIAALMVAGQSRATQIGEAACPSAQTSRAILDHRRRPDRHRPGLRVRLLRRAGLQGAARGGLPGRPGQQQPGDDHDRPGHGRRRPTSSRSPGRRSRRSSRKERPDALLPTMGGQTALNCALDLAHEARRAGEATSVELIGATPEAIDKAEDRQLFRDGDDARSASGRPRCGIAHTMEEALRPSQTTRRLPGHDPPVVHAGRLRRRHRLQPRRVRGRSASAASSRRRPTSC